LRSTTFLFRFVVTATIALASAGIASAGSITTLFGVNNSGGVGATVMFDIQVLNPSGITITAADLNNWNGEQNGLPFGLNVYITPTTYVGKESNAGLWSLVSTGSGIGAAANSPAAVELTDFFLAAGTYGIAFQSPDFSQGYTNGANVYSNADVQLTLGASTSGALFGPSVNTPRTWNGTIYYDAASAVPEPSTYVASATGLLALLALRARRKRAR